MFKKIVLVSFISSFSSFIKAADVQISALVDDVDPSTRGGQITYTASVLNAANDTATNVNLIFPIPATTNFVSVNNGLCAHDGGAPGQVNCALGSMVGNGLGGPITDVEFVIQTTGATGNTVAVSSTISADSDSDLLNNTENQNTTIDDGADLLVAVTDIPDPALAGGTISYTITASNVGPNDAGAAFESAGVTVENTLPVGVTFSSSNGVGWSCNNLGQVVTCDRAIIADGTSAPDITIVGNITGQIVGTITNTLTVSSITADPEPSNNTITEDTLINEGTDLSITKTVVSPVIANTTTAFTLSPRNNGPYDANNVSVTDTLPAGFTLVSFLNTNGWACGNIGLDITCTRLTYSIGSTDDIVIETNVPASGSNITNSTTIASVTADPDNSNNTGSVNFSIVPDGADLSISKVKTPDPVAQGSNMTSVISVSNLGPQDTSGVVTVVDLLSAGETFVSGSDANWLCNLAGGSPGGTLTCEYQGGILATSTSTPDLTIVTTATNAGLLQNDASASDVGGQSDAVAGNNGSSASVASTAAIADLSMVKTVSDNNLDIGEDSTVYTLTVTNNGPNDIVDPGVTAEGVIISDAIPGQISGVVGAVPNSTGVAVPANVISNLGANFSCAGTSTVVCTLDDNETFVNGDFIAVDITLTRPLQDGTRTNTATVTTEVLGDDDLTNNSDSVDLTVAPLADVEMLLPSIPVNPAIAGTEATILLQFRNNGPSTAAGVEVVHVFNPPAGRSYSLISATPTEGSCGALIGNTLTCTGLTLSQNENRQITLVVRPGWDGANNNWTLGGVSTITTTTDQEDNGVNFQNADLDVEQAELDLLVENNDVTDPVGWAAGPGAFPATLDNVVVYKVDVTNRGPSLATDVQLIYEMAPKLGKGVTFLCDSTNPNSCIADASSTCDNLGTLVTGGATLTLTCNLPDNSGDPLLNDQELAANTLTSRYLFFRAETAPDSTGDTHNTLATISSNEDDNLAGNDSESESTSLRVKVDLGVTKATAQPIVGLKQPFDFLITVVNNGPGDSAGSTLTDNLPANMTLTGPPIPSQGSCTGVDGDISYSCDLQTIINGANATVIVPVEVDVLGGITNTAFVSTFGVDTDDTNDSDDETVTVVKSSIAGTVFNDLDDDGIQDIGDSNISGVQMTLTGTSVAGEVINLVTTTVNGDYLFDNLSASDGAGYTITETQLAGFTDGLESIAGVVIPGSRSTDAITNITVGINDTLTDFDFANLGRGSISGVVWLDEDDDGFLDGNETDFIGNVQIQLTGTELVSGIAVNITTSTSANGLYRFIDLRAGTYTVTEVQPIAWADGKEAIGSLGGVIAVDQFSNIVLATDTDQALNYNFGELGASLSGVVYQDLNFNGIDDLEPKISQVNLMLTGSDINGRNVNFSSQTNSLGVYQFGNLPAANGAGYTITETQPDNYTDGAETIGSLGGNNSVNDTFSAIVLPAGGDGVLYNFGEGVLLESSIAGFVYQDVNDDGIKDPLEQGISNVELSLSGKTSDGYQLNQIVQTSADGSYLFERLGVSDVNGYQISELQPSEYDDGLENIDGVIQAGSRSTDLIEDIALGVNEALTNYNFAELPAASVSGTVYIDLNNDGIQQPEEPGIENVNLTLTGVDFNGNTINQEAITDNNGDYFFNHVSPSGVQGYQIEEEQPEIYDDGLENIDGVVVDGSDTSDRLNAVVVIGVPAINFDFGERYSSAVSGAVFIDPNNDGVRADDDLGIEGVIIHLSGVDVNENPVNLSSITAADGSYRFDNLAPSNSSGYTLTEQHPTIYIDGFDSIEGEIISNSDQTDIIQLPVLLAQQEQANNLFAEIAGISIQGTVWADSNDNGLLEDNEDIRIEEVVIELSGVDFLGNNINQSTLTDSDGKYEFTRVLNGTYAITQIQPGAWLDGKEQLGSLGGTQTNDQFSNIQVINLDFGTDYNFGERGSSIAGLVYSDLDDDAEVDSNEAGIPEVLLQLNGIDSDGHSVTRSVQTAVDGRYRFINLPLPNGQGFTITETQPENTIDGKDSLGSLSGDLANDKLSQIIFTQHITSAIEYNFGERLLFPAKISGFVWLDKNHNRNEDENNGQPDWIVELIQYDDNPLALINAEPIATAISGSDGRYLLDGLSPGVFEVRFRHPQGGILYGIPVSSQVGVDTSHGTIRNLLLQQGEHIEEQNLPIDPSGVIYDSQTREPVEGAIVRIVGPVGFNASQHLLGGENNVEQTTASDGIYQFLLFSSAPPGIYNLEITEASGYLPGVAPSLPACSNILVVGATPNPALVHVSDLPPAISSERHTPDNCPSDTTALGSSNSTTQFYLNFEIDPLLPSTNVVNNHIPLDPYSESLISVNKTSTVTNVSRGEFVPYQISITNNNNFAVFDLTVIDQLPPGFKYVSGSAKVAGVAIEPLIGDRTLSWTNIDLAENQNIIIDLMTIVGSGVGEGQYVNQAWLVEPTLITTVSNMGQVSIRVTPDPIFDCSDLIGKVFDDENVNGYQDEKENGLPGIRLATAKGLLVTTDENGRYHIACAGIPNEMRGSNFIVKVDERTLPSGYRITTENPRVTRLTRGKLAKVNFGATIHKVIRVEVNHEAFERTALIPKFSQQLTRAISIAKLRPSVIRIAYQQYSESDSLVQERIEQMKLLLESTWNNCECNYPLTIEQEVFRRKIEKEIVPFSGRVN